MNTAQRIRKSIEAPHNLPQGPLRVQITKTADGQNDYIQILSADQFSLNIVLISSKITIDDRR